MTRGCANHKQGLSRLLAQPPCPWAVQDTACALQVVHGRIPERYPYSDAPVAVFHSLNDFVGSFRHALFDFILPVFNLMQLFRMYTPEFLLIEATHQVVHPLPAQSLTALLPHNVTPRYQERVLYWLRGTQERVLISLRHAILKARVLAWCSA